MRTANAELAYLLIVKTCKPNLHRLLFFNKANRKGNPAKANRNL